MHLSLLTIYYFTVQLYLSITHVFNSQRRKVWVSCMGERPADTEALGDLKYYPYPGLSETYFPYDNTPGYLSPLVAVQLLNPRRKYYLCGLKIRSGTVTIYSQRVLSDS